MLQNDVLFYNILRIDALFARFIEYLYQYIVIGL